MMPPTPFVLAYAVFAIGLAAGAPLLAYTLSLAVFGLPHVLAEMRYVDDRFGGRLDRRMIIALVALIATALALRLAAISGVLPGGDVSGRGELFVLAGLGALALPSLLRRGPARSILGFTICGAIGAAAIIAPIETLITLAVLHNVSPVAFLAERLRGRHRRRVLLACGLLFGLIPVVIASGLPLDLMTRAGLSAPNLSWLGVDSLSSQMGAFLPGGMRENPRAASLFSAAVYLQLLHYGAVLYVLPRLARERVSGRWPRQRRGILALGIAGALFFSFFAMSFGDAKAAYGLFALVHAWIELPLLLGAIGAAPHKLRGWVPAS